MMQFSSPCHSLAAFRSRQYAVGRAVGVDTDVLAISGMWLDVEQWNIVLWLGLGFALSGLRIGWWRTCLFPPLAMLLGYFIIVVSHEADIYRQVGASWNRQTVHVMPFLLMYLVSQWAVKVSPDHRR